jgi:hypothetical protein
MEHAIVLGHRDERKLFQQVVGQYGGPAFARRARAVQSAYDGLIEACRRQREEWLDFVRLRVGTLFALAGSAAGLATVLDGAGDRAALIQLHEQLQPRLRVPVAATSNRRTLFAALMELRETIARFNERWLTFVRQVDVGTVNALRDGYNRFYVLEKECAVGSPRVARQGFRRLEPLTADDVLRALPVLTQV